VQELHARRNRELRSPDLIGAVDCDGTGGTNPERIAESAFGVFDARVLVSWIRDPRSPEVTWSSGTPGSKWRTGGAVARNRHLGRSFGDSEFGVA
jgi:hypothetical protein